METTVEKHRIIEANAKLFLKWMRERGGIAIWGCLDLADPSKTWSTPVLTANGEHVTKPHWAATNEPIRVITVYDEILVDTPKEIQRFHVALKRGSGLSVTLTSASTAKVEKALAKVGPEAWREFDYASQECVILVPDVSMPLSEWANKYGE